MPTVRIWLFFMMAAAVPWQASAQVCKIEPAQAFRGDQIRLTLPPGTTARTARISLRPMARLTGPGALQQSTPVEYRAKDVLVGVDGTSMAFVVPPDAPLGRYTVTATLDDQQARDCATVQVALPEKWKLALAEFSPSGTYDVERQKVTRGTTTAEAKTVRLTLRGTGFIDDVWEDNRIFINGNPQPVVWDQCPAPSLPSDAPSAELVVHGEVISSEQIELCGVEVPGIHRVLTVEVSQAGIPRGTVRYFRLYWWDRKMVGTVAGLVALVLAGGVLALVRSYKRNQIVPEPLNVLQILFLDPETETYSLSKLQFYLWTFAALFGYAYLAISRLFIQGEQWPDIPDGLPAVIALGAGTAVGAQIVQNTRGPKGSGAERPNLGDFVTSGGVAAPERVQMLVWTIVGICIFVFTALQHGPEEIQALDPVPSGLLYLMGLSSLGYLGGKLARGAGPIINELSIVPAEPEDMLQGASTPRVIELRGRNLSDQALFSIDQAELPFRMLRPDAHGKQVPEIVIREKNDPALAVVLRLTIDPARLEEPDLRQYRAWFGTASPTPRTLSIINLDGQRSDISFTVPPAAAQKLTDTADQPK